MGLISRVVGLSKLHNLEVPKGGQYEAREKGGWWSRRRWVVVRGKGGFNPDVGIGAV